MLSKLENERLCRIGPGTAMGDVFRRYWNPVCLVEQLPPPDGKPLRVQALGECLVAFRDTAGTVGLMGEACPHRGVSLALGRVEHGGIRCLYHGWKFDVKGAVLETPNLADERVRQRLKARNYPVREAAGLLWAYMGPADKEPPFPNWRFMDMPVDHLKVVRNNAEANYMQQLEGGTDTAHVGILHSNQARPGWMAGEFNANTDRENTAALASDDLAPALEVVETDFGFHYAALRKMPPGDAGAEMRNVRVVPIVMPSTRIIPSPDTQVVVFEVPMTDTKTAAFTVAYRPDGKPFDSRKFDQLRGRDNPALFDPSTHEYLGNWDNAFGQDREAMAQDWSGIRGIHMEDMAMSVSAGPILDRSIETLMPSDRALVKARRQLLDAADRVAEGGDPTGLNVDFANIMACDVTTTADVDWQTLVPQGREAQAA
jgi:phenylpropionate dioxygenase-like ring-hydroxylating dioxygenase large terminal subunit